MVTILSALFHFTISRINQVRDEMKAEIDSVRHDLDGQAGEHRQAQQQLWSEMRINEQRSTDHRQRIQERIGYLPTRDEMKSDLKAMEERMTKTMLRDEHNK